MLQTGLGITFAISNKLQTNSIDATVNKSLKETKFKAEREIWKCPNILICTPSSTGTSRKQQHISNIPPISSSMLSRTPQLQCQPVEQDV
jgi:hypothetical protein